jgi:hypothetical protein
MCPRPHDQAVRGSGTLACDGREGSQRAHQVLRVVPATHGQHGGRDVAEVPPDRAVLPERVVGGVLEVGHPVRIGIEAVASGHLGKRTGLEVEPVPVVRAVVERRVRRCVRLRLGPPRRKPDVEAEVVRQHEGAVVERVVAEKVVGDRGLRGHRPKRRMSVDHAGRHVEAGVRHPPHAHAAVVAGDGLQQPVDRVPGVRALVHGRRRLPLTRHVRPHFLPDAFRQVPAPHVLVDEDEAVALEMIGRAERASGGARAIRPGAIRRPLQHERVSRLHARPGRVDDRVQARPVTHRNDVLGLDVGGRCGARVGRRRLARGGTGGTPRHLAAPAGQQAGDGANDDARESRDHGTRREPAGR